MRKMRKQPVGPLSPWDFGAEPGERVYERRGESAVMYDLRESTGWYKRSAGELTPHKVMQKGGDLPRLAVMDDDGVWYWED